MHDDRAGRVLRQDLLDLPHDPSAPGNVGFLRLLVEQPLDLRVAVLRVVAIGLAGVALRQGDVGIVEPGAGDVEGDRVVLPLDTAVPDRRFDDLQLGVEVDAG